MPVRVCRCAAIVLFWTVILYLPALGAGESVYAARFAEYKEIWESGVRLGTASGKSTTLELDGGELWLTPSGSAKSYLLLPDAVTSADTYAIEFTFRFADITASNGYIGFLLASQGDVPSGRTELIFRANGTVDGYASEANEEQRQAASSGEAITVQALVYYGYMMDFRVLAGGREILRRTPSSLVQVDPAGWGFVVRNATAAISSVRAVAGDYTALEGADTAPIYRAERPASPPTGDCAWIWLSMAVLTGTAGFVQRNVRKSHGN